MISVIVCSIQSPQWSHHERNVDKTIGSDYEYIRIDNRENGYGICGAYNRGVTRSAGNILVFVHEDVFFMETGWGKVLVDKFSEDPSLGLIGVAGTQYLFQECPVWIAAGQPFIRGRVIHELNGGEKYYLTVFSWDKRDAEVVAVDGLFFAIRATLFDGNGIKFDEDRFDDFHFYDLDICMQVRKTHRLIVTWDILVKHLSAGTCDGNWKRAARKFLEKYCNELPATCVQKRPLSGKKKLGVNYDLKGIVRRLNTSF